MYRNRVRRDHLVSFRVVVKETDLFVHAKKRLEKATREYPDLKGWSEATLFYLGSQYAQSGRREEALAAFHKCVELCRGVRAPDGFPWKNAREAIERLAAQP